MISSPSRRSVKLSVLLLAILLSMAVSLFAQPLSAQDAPAADVPATQQQQLLDAAQLDQLVAPIALYPDALLAQVLMASTYPLEVVQADRWAKSNSSLKGAALDTALGKQDWDASVKQLVSTPTVLDMMNDKLDWTQALGDAVLAQQADVMDAIQRLRVKAQENGKLETTKQQTIKTTQEADKQVVVIEPAEPDTVYVPYYEPAVVYGAWPYPAYPPYSFPPPPGWVVGGAIASGIAWGAGFAIGHEIWDDFDWGHGNINVDIDRDVNINRNIDVNNVNVSKWEHNSYHRRGVSYNNVDVKNKFAKTNVNAGDRKLDFRGHGGEQVLKPGGGDRPNIGGGDRPGGADRPDLGGKGQGPGKKPDIGQIQEGLKQKGPGKQAALEGQKPDLGKPKPKGKPGGNAFDPSDGAKAKDFSKRGQASLGNRGAHDFARPSSGGGGKAVRKGGGGGAAHLGGGGRGGGHGGGGRRR